MKNYIKFIILMIIISIFIPTVFASFVILIKDDIDTSKYSDSKNISLRFQIEDNKGNLFLNLKQGDISLNISSLKTQKIVDNFNLEKILSPDHPFYIVFLIDCSESMSGKPFSETKTAVKEFLNQLRDIDKVMLISFSDDVKILNSFNSDISQAKRLIDSLQLGEFTVLYDSINEAIEELKKIVSRNKFIILLTDGIDSKEEGYPIGSKLKLDDVVSKVASSNIPIYAIGLGNVDKEKLERIVKSSGGKSLYTPNPSEIRSLYQNVLELLKDEYVLNFKDPIEDKTKLRKIQMKVNINGTQYLVEKSFILPNFNKGGAKLNLFLIILIISIIVGVAIILILLFFSKRTKTPIPPPPISPPS